MKKEIKIICSLIFLAVCSSSALFATPLDFKNSVGIYALVDTEAMGIQYQRWCTDKIGFQTQGYVFYDELSGDGASDFNCSLSTELQLKLFETLMGEKSASILYAWFLAGYQGSSSRTWNNSQGDYGAADYVPGYYTQGDYKSSALMGLGFGFDIMFLNHISIPIQFGFSGSFPNDISAGFCFGAGLRYRF